MKKLLAMLLALVMVFALVPAAFADGADYTLTIAGGNVKDHMETVDGQKVLAVDLTLSSSVDETIYGMTFDLTYDASQLTYVACSAGEGVALPTVSANAPGAVRAAFVSVDGFKAASQKVLTLYFALSLDLETGAQIAFALANANVETTDVTHPVDHGMAANFAPFSFTGTMPKVSKQPKSVTVANGKDAKFTAAGSGEKVTYQWYYSKDNGKKWTKWSGKTSTSVTVKAEASKNGYLYRFVVSNIYGDAVSKDVKLTVSGVKPRIVVQPKGVTLAKGETATFSIVAAGVKVTYQWYYSKDNGAKWTKISGATTNSIEVEATADKNGYKYHCVVKNDKGSVTSKDVALTVSGAEPKVFTQPKSVTVANGKTATFKFEAAAAGKSYQWYYSKNNGTTWKVWSGQTGTSAKVKAAASKNGYKYKCVLTYEGGKTLESKVAKLTVSGVKPRIVVQPANVTTSIGQTVTFKVVAAGTGLKYQWQYSKNNGTTWKNIKGETKASFSVEATAKNDGYHYRCVVKNTKGSVNSSGAELKLRVEAAVEP